MIRKTLLGSAVGVALLFTMPAHAYRPDVGEYCVRPVTSEDGRVLYCTRDLSLDPTDPACGCDPLAASDVDDSDGWTFGIKTPTSTGPIIEPPPPPPPPDGDDDDDDDDDDGGDDDDDEGDDGDDTGGGDGDGDGDGDDDTGDDDDDDADDDDDDDEGGCQGQGGGNCGIGGGGGGGNGTGNEGGGVGPVKNPKQPKQP